MNTLRQYNKCLNDLIPIQVINSKPLLLKKRVMLPAILMLILFLVYVAPTRSEDSTDVQERISDYIKYRNPGISYQEHQRLVRTIVKEAKNLKISSAMKIDDRSINRVYFLTAMINVESTFHQKSISRANARGYMQLMPDTAEWLNHKKNKKIKINDLFNTKTNLSLGVNYLNYLITEFNDTRMVCLAYNAGPGALRRGQYLERYWTAIVKSYRNLSGDSVL